MIDSSRLLPYTLAVVALVLAPGPNQAMVIARSLNGGRRAGITASFGINAGTFVHTIAAAVGLSAVIATSAVAFTAVKVVGALYLFYLGTRLVFGRDHDAPLPGGHPLGSRPPIARTFLSCIFGEFHFNTESRRTQSRFESMVSVPLC